MPKKRSSLVVRKPDGSYRCDFWARFPDGTRDRIRVVAPGKTENAANTWAERHRRELETQGRPEDRAPAQTMADFYPRFVVGHIKANGLKPSQIEAHRSIWETHLRDRFGRLPLDAIGPEQIQGLKSAMADRAPKTLNNVLTVLKTILRRAQEWGEIETLPKIEPVRVPRRSPEFYDFAEFDRLVVAAEACGPMILAMVLLGARAGLRDGEARALRWSDVDLSRRIINVRRTLWQDTEGATKGAEERQVPIASELLAALEALPRHKKGDRVLYTTRSDTLSHMGLVKWLEKAKAGAGLTKGTPHTLRHTFASHLAMLGASMQEIQRLLGHKDLKTTMIYAHLSPGHLTQTVGRFDTLATLALSDTAKPRKNQG